MNRICHCVLIFIIILFSSCERDDVDKPQYHKGRTEWLLMMYIAGDNDLSSQAYNTIVEMMGAELNGNSQVRVIALLDYYGDNNSLLFEIQQGNTIRLSCAELGLNGSNPKKFDGEVDMGDQDTLSEFVSFCQNNYAADYHALVLWNHGGGWRSETAKRIHAHPSYDIAYDMNMGESFLSTDDVQKALWGKPIDVIAIDACLMATIEFAYELRTSVSDCTYLVASQDVTTILGLPYFDILDHLINSKKTGPKELAMLISDSFCDSDKYAYPYFPGNNISLIDLRMIEEVTAKLDNLVTEISAMNQDRLDVIRSQLQQTYDPSLVDLGDLAIACKTPAGEALLQSIQDCVVNNRLSGQYEKYRFHGLSINFSTMNHDRYYSSSLYPELDFFFNSTWDDFLTSRSFGMTIDVNEPGNDKENNCVVRKGDTVETYTSYTNDTDTYTLKILAGGSVIADLSQVPLNIDLALILDCNNDAHTIIVKDIAGIGGNENITFDNAQSGDTILISVKPSWGYSIQHKYKIVFSGNAEY